MKSIFNSSSQRWVSLTLVLLFAFTTVKFSAQCKPMIKIDGVASVVNPNDDFALHFPYWLHAGQTLAVGSSVSAVSVIEFNLTNGALEIEQVLSITSTTPVQVPDGKVWKLESALTTNNSSSYKNSTFASPGTYTFTVPGCAEQICIEAWAGGGGGSSAYYSTTNTARRPGGGGGGGGYGSQCFTVLPGAQYTVTVGAGGAGGSGTGSSPFGNNGAAGGTTSVGSLITVNGGAGGQFGSSFGAGGVGGTSAALNNASGAQGGNGANVWNGLSGGGGAGANGGGGGASVSGSTNGNPGAVLGGGGSGGGGGDAYNGGRGGDGRVIISW